MTICPPPFLPPSPNSPDGRIVRCSHIHGQSVWLFRNFDLPHVLHIAFNDGAPIDCYLDYETALIAFYEAEANLLDSVPPTGSRETVTHPKEGR